MEKGMLLAFGGINCKLHLVIQVAVKDVCRDMKKKSKQSKQSSLGNLLCQKYFSHLKFTVCLHPFLPLNL